MKFFLSPPKLIVPGICFIPDSSTPIVCFLTVPPLNAFHSPFLQEMLHAQRECCGEPCAYPARGSLQQSFSSSFWMRPFSLLPQLAPLGSILAAVFLSSWQNHRSTPLGNNWACVKHKVTSLLAAVTVSTAQVASLFSTACQEPHSAWLTGEDLNFYPSTILIGHVLQNFTSCSLI